MYSYVVRRLLLMLPTLFGITLVVFVVMAASPGGITAQSLVEGQNLDPQAKKALETYYNRLYGLDQPAPIQYLRWLNNISPVGFTFDDNNHISGFSLDKGSDLGRSFRYGRPVKDLLAERVPITILLNVITLPIIYAIAIAVGLRAALQRGQTFDVTSSSVMLALWSVPTMLAGVLLIGFFANTQYWQWFPTAGLSTREALDMPFLPHFRSAVDVMIFIGAPLLATVGATALSALPQRGIRTVVFAVLGAALGALMAKAMGSDAGVATYLVLVLSGAGLLAGLAHMDFTGLRVALLGTAGALVGLGLGLYWLEGQFVRGFLVDRLWHLALPVLCLSYGSFAFLAKLTRTAILENLLADYARTARAKGVPENQVLWHHVFRNSLLPLITVSAGLLPGLLGGSVIVESIFSIDGMGKLAVEAVQARDRELVLSLTLISGLLTLAGYLIADLCYALADPRVSYD
jgi:peptide/nickel transport system permease protein